MNLPSTGIDRTRRAVAKLLPAWTMLLALGFMSPAMATDIDGAPVFLGKSSWELGYVAERFPKVTLSRSKERG